jgi:hypothetical protein
MFGENLGNLIMIISHRLMCWQMKVSYRLVNILS